MTTAMAIIRIGSVLALYSGEMFGQLAFATWSLLRRWAKRRKRRGENAYTTFISIVIDAAVCTLLEIVPSTA